jgi:hypothetical protein
MKDRYDDLDRAIFSLPLEEPPGDLRAAILASTVEGRPRAVRTWEAWLLGIVSAVAVWLALPYVSYGLAMLGRPDVLFWTVLGAGAAFWISQMNLIELPEALRVRRR